MRTYFGKYKGFCRDYHDPKMRGRIRAEVPFPLGVGPGCWSLWAEPCFQANSFHVPEEGDGVWIEFEGGDIGKPIWAGIWYKGAGPTSEAIFQGTHAVLTDDGGVEVDTDKADHTDPEEMDDAEHREYHDHAGGQFYSPHRSGWQSPTGHVLEFNDHPGREGALRIVDRTGRGIEFFSKGLTRLKGFLAGQATAFFNDLNGAPVDAENYLLLADYQNIDLHGTDATKPGLLKMNAGAADPIVPAKWYLLLKGMATHFLRMVSDPGKEHLHLGDFWGQYIKINSVSGQEWVEVKDKEGNTVRLAAGSITITAAVGDVHLNLPSGGSLLCDGEPLARESFVNNVYKNHIHPSSTGPTGVPVPLGTENIWPQVSNNKL